MKFIVYEMTALKYFMPLIIEGNNRGMKSEIIVGRSTKYNSPQTHMKTLKMMSKEYDFDIINLNSSTLYKDDLFFFVEGVGADRIKINGKRASLTYVRDFSKLYPSYIDDVDAVIFPSEAFAKHYGTMSEKNMYFGSPKYDVEFDSDEIYEKYGIPRHRRKTALFLFPRLKYNTSVNILKNMIDNLKKMGIYVIVKTRGKDIVTEQLRGDMYFEDKTWFPHTTMELMQISDFAVNFDSTAIKECIMMDLPILNFHIKPERKFGFLYNKYVVDAELSSSFDKMKSIVDYLLNTDFDPYFKKTRKNFLFDKGEVSKKILDALL